MNTSARQMVTETVFAARNTHLWYGCVVEPLIPEPLKEPISPSDFGAICEKAIAAVAIEPAQAGTLISLSDAVSTARTASGGCVTGIGDPLRRLPFSIAVHATGGVAVALPIFTTYLNGDPRDGFTIDVDVTRPAHAVELALEIAATVLSTNYEIDEPIRISLFSFGRGPGSERLMRSKDGYHLESSATAICHEVETVIELGTLGSHPLERFHTAYTAVMEAFISQFGWNRDALLEMVDLGDIPDFPNFEESV